MILQKNMSLQCVTQSSNFDKAILLYEAAVPQATVNFFCKKTADICTEMLELLK